jgi:hypothetical protein
MANQNAIDGMYKESNVPALFNFSDSNILGKSIHGEQQLQA